MGGSGPVPGRDAYVRHMQRVYQELPDWRFETVHLYGDEQVLLAEFDGAGHFSGRHEGREYPQVPLRVGAVCIFEAREVLIYRVREYFDHRGYERQLKSGHSPVVDDEGYFRSREEAL